MDERSGASRRQPAPVLLVALAVALALLGAVLALAPPARALQPYSLSFSDNDFNSADARQRQLAFDRAANLRGSYVRIGARWARISPHEPRNPADSEDRAYDFDLLDQAVTEALERGLVPMLTVVNAPRWAEGRNRPASALPGTWKPNAHALGLFARALVSRYDGTHPDPRSPGGVLPEVVFYEVWNEPTLPMFLAPQWRGGQPRSPEIYRRMLNAFSANARDVNPGVKIAAGSMSPYGDGPGGERMYPMRFARELLCLRGKRRLRPQRHCRKASFDILSSHPISPYASPRLHAEDPQDLAIADLGELRRMLRTAERRHTVPASPPRPLWVSEFWWETRPPEDRAGTPSLQRQARWIAEAQLLFWKQRVPVAMQFGIADDAFDPGEFWAATWQTGLLFRDGRPKPSLAAARFPVAAERRGRRRAFVWARPPASGTLTFEQRVDGRWRALTSLPAEAGVPRGRVVGMRYRGRLRAVVGGRTSYVYRLGRERGRRRGRYPSRHLASGIGSTSRLVAP